VANLTASTPHRPVVDANATVDRVSPTWGETRWHCCWSPDAGVGMYIHTGRFRKDVDMWWAHIAAYLPDGHLAVDRQWCRNTSVAGVNSQNLALTITPTGWHSTFDGVGELTSTADLSRSVRGSGAPSVALRWDVTAHEAAPVWDLYSAVDEQQDFASDIHIQQATTTTGTLWVDGQSFPLDGVGFKDHSSGARSFAAWHGHRFMIAVMPEWVIHAVTIFRDNGIAADPVGVVMSDGHCTPVEQFDLPALADPQGVPRDQEMIVTGRSGPIRMRVEVIHAFPITITEDNDNYNGIDWDIPSDPMVMIEGIVRLTGPDGSVGFGFLERSARQSTLPMPGAGGRS
jgi:hypothetical protein